MNLSKLNNEEKVLWAITRFKNKEIGYHYFRDWILPYASHLQDKLGYERSDFQNDLDKWFEYIEFCYKEADQRKLTLSIATFLEDIIKRQEKIVLPVDDRVIKEQF